jgi:uncharacterized phage protein (TIGR02218 family)
VKQLSPALTGVLYGSNVHLRANLYTAYLVGPLSGTVVRWTDGESDITMSGTVYRSDLGVVKRSRSRQSAGNEVDDCDVGLMVQPLANSLGASFNALIGSFDQCRFTIQKCYGTGSYSEFTALGTIPDVDGLAVPTNIGSTTLELSVRSFAEAFTEPLPRRLFQPGCPYAVYGSGCNLSPALFRDGRIVAAGSTASSIVANAAFDALNSIGWIIFNNGALAGQTRQVKSVGGATAALAVAFPQAPAVGDSFYAVKGCDKTRDTCRVTFNNLVNFGGYPDIPQAATMGH